METTRERVLEVLEVLAWTFAVKRRDLRDEMRLAEDVGCDDLDLVEMLMALEKSFAGIECTDDVAMHWRTVGDVVRGVEGLLANL